MPDRTPTESVVVEALAQAAAEGDREAQGQLMRHYWPMIQRVVRYRLQRSGPQLALRQSADDLVQEACIRLLQELPNHEWQGKGAFIRWLKAVIDNHLRDIQRFHSAEKRDRAAETAPDTAAELPREARSPESLFDQDRDVAMLRALLDQLDSEQSAAVEMYSLGFSHSEIGETLGRTPEAARKVVARALVKLQSMRGV